MASRYALIWYQVDGEQRVGSGLLVRDRAVLTAEHVAVGDRHRVQTEEGKALVQWIVRSGNEKVDLAVLLLAEPVTGITPLPGARIDRSRAANIDGFGAVGFPKWKKEGGERVTAQVLAYLRAADDHRMETPGGTDGQPLTLIVDRQPGDPDLPADTVVGYDERSPWSGMSGAVVLWDDRVVGVISSHERRKSFQALGVTPLTALKLLPEQKQRDFCSALGLANLDDLPVITSHGIAAPTPPPPPPGGRPAFSAQVRERFTPRLAGAGLTVPDRWDEVTLQAMCQAHPDSGAAADTLEALCLAASALPLLNGLGWEQIGSRKLKYLYQRHVGRWPEGRTRDEMLVEAAAATVSERRWAAAESGYQPVRLTALARFLLAVAGAASHTISLSDPDLRGLADWLTGPLMQQLEDAESYFTEDVGSRAWALIELSAPEDLLERGRPDAIVVHVIPERGQGTTCRIPCGTEPGAVSEEEVLHALREAVDLLPVDGEVLVDLCLPRRWLDAGIEQWQVVDIGGIYASLSEYYSPRLRWAMHRNDPRLRALLEKRWKAIDWSAEPVVIPPEATADAASFQDWLAKWDEDGLRHPPYFAGTSASGDRHDPLGTLLLKGYGFAVWFTASGATPEAADDAARAAATGVGVREVQARMNELPGRLATEFRKQHPVIVWSDPEGREGFRMPVARGGTRRGGVR